MKKLPEHTIIGVAACAGVYLFVFMYLQVSSFSNYVDNTHFETYSKLDSDEIRLRHDNIDNPMGDRGGDVSNVSRDMNDDRPFSEEDWSESSYEGDPSEVAKEVERQFFDDAGGEEQRKELLKEHEARIDNSPGENENSNQVNTSSGNQKSGNVMVEWELNGRKAYKNDNWYVRNPGYTCGYNSNGTVEVRIKVNRSGIVLDATVQGLSSSAVSACMQRKAIEYAKKSRFNYNPQSASVQIGIIRYTFVAQ